MRKIVLSFVIVIVAATASYAAWLTNVNHHCQFRVPNGWNSEYQVMVKDKKQAHIVLAAPEKGNMVAAIMSMDIESTIELDDFMAFFEGQILENATVVEKQKRGFNNLKGYYVIYDAEFGGTPMRLMCFFTQKRPYFYAVFAGTPREDFDDKKHFLDELIVTIQFVK